MQEVIHSAMHRSWGMRGKKFIGGSDQLHQDTGGGGDSGKVLMYMETQLPLDENQQHMQLWADWYTILTAKMVYHTHSDFSVSAIHWQTIPSKVIGDVVSGELQLTGESWIVDGETARLIDRRVGAEGTSELRACDHGSPVISADDLDRDGEYDI